MFHWIYSLHNSWAFYFIRIRIFNQAYCVDEWKVTFFLAAENSLIRFLCLKCLNNCYHIALTDRINQSCSLTCSFLSSLLLTLVLSSTYHYKWINLDYYLWFRGLIPIDRKNLNVCSIGIAVIFALEYVGCGNRPFQTPPNHLSAIHATKIDFLSILPLSAYPPDPY